MEKFIYTPGVTTEDDVIAHLFVRLNEDFLHSPLNIKGFCRPVDDVFDPAMVQLVLSKMLEYGIAERWPDRDEFDTEVKISAKGIRLYKKGMTWWAILEAERAHKEMVEQELKSKLDKEEREKLEERQRKERSTKAAESSAASALGSKQAAWFAGGVSAVALLVSIYAISISQEKESTLEKTQKEVSSLTQRIDSLERIQSKQDLKRNTSD